ncbi:MAG: serine/threonine-protein kinase [Phycisphaerae bacterium]|nr:serine/threonine-protein kinase [Phycisphaerae bacterium]
MQPSSAELERLFNAAIERPTPAERAAFLDGACGTDTALRRRLDALLLAHGSAGSFMGAPIIDADATVLSAAGERPGTMIGPYKLLQLIGEGGFGAVYMAEQEQPVRRKVALKIIKLGMDTRQVIARFEAERQALALMDHPNIARVLDAGATETGRPYFVMELVRGIRITEYCDKHKLLPRQRLELFIQICRAVQHAHQKGVIHRDIKPSNILVTLHDGVPVPKVIDFGIAKATSQRLTDKTLFTEFKQFIGTPEYMSPEQAEMSGLDIDTRTDIYALGVLLYELLTGTTPVDGTTLRRAGYGEIQRIIREEEAPMPSTRVSTLAHAAATADLRGVEPAALRRLLRGDLDWIVMKAIEKDRTRRYSTAVELSADVERYLRNEPVLAGPPGAYYKLRKFARRHRGSVLAGSAIGAALLAGCALAVLGFVQAKRERDEALEAQARANNQSAFLQQLIARLDAGDSDAQMSLDDVVQRGRALFGDDHAIVASLLMTRAASQRIAGQFEESARAHHRALDVLRSAADHDEPAIAAVLSSLGALHRERGQHAEAEAVLREALELKRRALGRDNRLVADAEGALVEVLNELDGSSTDEVSDLWNDAIRIYEMELGPEHRTTVRALCSYATWLYNKKRYEQAAVLLPVAVERARRVLPSADLSRLLAVNAMTMLVSLQQQNREASVPLYSELIKLCRDNWGAVHEASLGLTIELAGILRGLGQREAAMQRLRQYLEDRRGKQIRTSQILFLRTRAAYIALRDWLDDYPAEGREFILHMVADGREIHGADSNTHRDSLQDAAAWLLKHRFSADAEPLLAELIDRLRERDRPQELAAALLSVGLARCDLGRWADAEAPLREALALRQQHLSPIDAAMADAAAALGACLAELERFDEAQTLLLGAHASLQASPQAPPQTRRETVERLIRLYDRWGRPDRAMHWRSHLEGLGS